MSDSAARGAGFEFVGLVVFGLGSTFAVLGHISILLFRKNS
jgi:hypothetical protein